MDYLGRDVYEGEVVYYAGQSGHSLYGNVGVIDKVNRLEDGSVSSVRVAKLHKYKDYKTGDIVSKMEKSTIRRVELVVQIHPQFYNDTIRELLGLYMKEKYV